MDRPGMVKPSPIRSVKIGGKPLVDLKLGMAAAANNSGLIVAKAAPSAHRMAAFMMNWIAGNWNDGFKMHCQPRRYFRHTFDVLHDRKNCGSLNGKMVALILRTTKHEKFNPSPMS